MRDYRVHLAVAVPAAFAMLAVLWILRRKSGKGGKPSGKSSPGEKSLDVLSAEPNSEVMVSNRILAVEKEGITITQRKIPETQARDRGDADLSHNAPDFTAGIGLTKPVLAESPVCARRNLQQESAGLAVVEDAAENSDSAHGEVLTQVQLDQVEKMIMSAMGDGLHEATGKLMSSQGQGDGGDLDQSLSASSGIELMERCGQSYHDTLAAPVEAMASEKVVTCSSVATIGFDVSDEKKGSDNLRSTAVKEPVISEAAVMPVSVSHEEAPTPEMISETAAEGGYQCSPRDQAAFFLSSDLHSSSVSSLETGGNPEHFISSDLTTQQQSSNQNSVPPFSPVFSSTASSLTTDPPLSTSATETQKPQKQITADQNAPLASSSASSNEAGSPIVLTARRRMAAMSTGSLESQASLGPEDIDSLWGIKPLSGASANWDRQLSLDDPDSPLRKTVLASESDISMLSSTTSTENVSPSVSSSFHSEQPVAASTEVVQSASAAPSIKENNATEEKKDTEQAVKSNSPLCDSNSEGSNDSGRGGSEHEVVAGGGGDPLIEIDFNIPSELCGRFIGRQGKNINFMKNKTGASISLTNNPFTADFQICQVAGTQTEVDSALLMIRRKFPLQDHPLLTMVPINISPVGAGSGEQQPFIVPDIMQLSLPEGVSVEVYVSAIVDAGHVFVQQPTHRSFMSLEKLTYHLNTVYGQDPNVPSLPTPVECGVICVVENEGYWYRAMVMSQENENGEAQIKFVDYGGYTNMHVSSLKQIRTDFMTLPFQAVECFMGNISPLQGEDYFSEEATNALVELTNMKLLQCQVVARSETGTPYIHLYNVNPAVIPAALINRELVRDQLVQWVELVSEEQAVSTT
ncbi:hypothetical protein EGW08_014165 [Elysia chlorotica]|uniref:Tudor domain-containing protein n=1 Tax=Elysia chlorotica TaxID=188477 RepID=A0A433T916_ELYCH|nr:hypothetical protein EGW08_014165 [Elysia chlorotica]